MAYPSEPHDTGATLKNFFMGKEEIAVSLKPKIY